MTNPKLREFLKIAIFDETITDKIDTATNKIQNGENARRIISKEIIPQARELGYEFTTDDFIDYIKNNANEITDEDLSKASGGVSLKGLASGLASGAVGFASAASIMGLASGSGGVSVSSTQSNRSSLKSLNGNRESSLSQAKKEKSSSSVSSFFNSDSLSDEGKKRLLEKKEVFYEKTEDAQQSTQTERKENFIDNANYVVEKIDNIEEERLLKIESLKDPGKTLEIPQVPPLTEGAWMPMGRATYLLTVIEAPGNISFKFDSSGWERFQKKNGKNVFIKKGTEAHKSFKKILEKL